MDAWHYVASGAWHAVVAQLDKDEQINSEHVRFGRTLRKQCPRLRRWTGRPLLQKLLFHWEARFFFCDLWIFQALLISFSRHEYWVAKFVQPLHLPAALTLPGKHRLYLCSHGPVSCLANCGATFLGGRQFDQRNGTRMRAKEPSELPC